jgi:hypothetical protein
MPRSIWNRFLCLSALALILLTTALVAAEGFEFRNGEFRLNGWTGGSTPPAEGWESVFSVYAGDSHTPMLGTYSVEGGTLVFRPRFPLAPDTGYHGTFHGGGFVLDPPPRRVPATRVEHVYPSTNVLPANTLKLYICFSAPMSAGDALQHIQLLDDAGTPLPGGFLDQELWDPDRTRLTVLFDPGRIKRGLVPAREAGAPIVEGRHYTLAIDHGWLDAHGAPLTGDFRKTFTGGPTDRTPPDPKHWRLLPPRAGTSDPLIVHFPKPMDYALLQRTVDVDRVAGSVSVADDETEWRFVPDTPWKAGLYHLTADNTLEDISGNHLDRPFDVDLRNTPPAPHANRTELPFRVN